MDLMSRPSCSPTILNSARAMLCSARYKRCDYHTRCGTPSRQEANTYRIVGILEIQIVRAGGS